MKRILLLMDAVGAPSYAPRMRYLVSHLMQKGWQLTVVSERMPNVDYSFSGCTHIQMPYYSDSSPLYNKIRWWQDKLFHHKDRLFYRFVKQHVNPADIDYIFCSTFHTFPLPTAARLAKEWQLPLITDLRDIAEQWGDTSYLQHPIHTPFKSLTNRIMRCYNALSIRERNKAIKIAQRVLTVSPWHQQVLSRYNQHTYLIYNGFDTADFYPKDIKSDKFIISYTGKLYNLTFRDPSLAFAALEQLLDAKQIAKEDVQVIFHIDNASITSVKQMAQHYRISDICTISGYIPKDEIVPLMHHSSIMLVLTCLSTSSGTHGIMGTKFYEALGVEKPVLCVRSDEECLAQVIEETHAGLAATNVEQVKDFILGKYSEWKQNGFTRQAVNQEAKKRFTRQYQSEQIEQILQNL